MKRILAPWRMKFVQTKVDGCIFCDVQQKLDNTDNLVIFRARQCFALLNRYPYTTGHLMVAANLHCPSLEDLDNATRIAMIELVTHSMRVLRSVYHPEAFNIGANIGEAAGAGFPGHIHIHVVPRWTGDSNFLSTLAETRVIPEALETTYARLLGAWNEV